MVISVSTFVINFEVLEITVKAIARDGRTRWKIENENNNILKTQGYHLEHIRFSQSQKLLTRITRIFEWCE